MTNPKAGPASSMGKLQLAEINEKISPAQALAHMETALGRPAAADPKGALHRALKNLAQESDAGIFFQDLLRLAQANLHHGDQVFSTTVLQALAESPQFFGLAVPNEIQQQARLHWDAMAGKGPLGERLGHLSQGFIKEVLSPGPLLAMGLAAPVYSFSRGKMLQYLMGRSSGFWTRGLGLKLASATPALGGEVMTFWGVNRTYTQFTHPELNRWDAQSVGQELAGLFMTFGLFKVNGFGFRSGAEALLKKSWFRRHSQKLMSDKSLLATAGGMGMYSGVLSSHYLEGKLGWRPEESLDHLFAGALVTTLQLKAMGQLSHRLMGPKYAAWMQKLEAEARSLEAPKFFGDGGMIPPLFDGLAKLFQPHRMLATPGGIRIPEGELPMPVRARDLVSQMAGINGNNGGKGPKGKVPSSPVTFKLAPGLPKNKPALPGGLSFALELFRLPESENHVKLKVVRELYEHENEVAEHLWRHFEFEADALGTSKNEIPGKVKMVLNQIRQYHFRGISQQFYEYGLKLVYLVGEVQRLKARAVESGSDEKVQKYDDLINGLYDKRALVARWYNESRSYLGDEKGPSKATSFSAAEYPALLEDAHTYFERLESYFKNHPDLIPLLKKWNQNVPAFGKPIDEKRIAGMIHRLDLPGPQKEQLKRLLPNDPILRAEDLRPLHAILVELNEGVELGRFAELLDPISDYLQARQALEPWTFEKDFQIKDPISQLTGETPFNTLRVLGNRLADKIVSRLEGRQEEQSIVLDMLGRYVSRSEEMLDLLSQYRTPYPVLKPLNWSVIRNRLFEFQEKGVLKPKTVTRLLEWTEGENPIPTFQSFREWIMTGMFEFLSGEVLEPAEVKQFSRFIDEVAERRDVAMMNSLAIRFHHIHVGEYAGQNADRVKGSHSETHQRWRSKNERYIRALLETASVYHQYPTFRGPYLAIQQKLQGGPSSHNANLVAPLDQRIRDLLQTYPQVELSEIDSSGNAIVRAIQQGTGKSVLKGITSIQAPLESRAHFLFWAGRIFQEIERMRGVNPQKYSNLPLEISIQIPKFATVTAKQDVLTWARDFLELQPSIDQVTLVIPKEKCQVRDPFDGRQFGSLVVDRGTTTTERNIEIFTSELSERPDDVGVYLKLYRHQKSMVREIYLETEPFKLLVEMSQRFPKNKTIQRELDRVLLVNFRRMVETQENHLSDFTPERMLRNQARRNLQLILDKDWSNFIQGKGERGNKVGIESDPPAENGEAESESTLPKEVTLVLKNNGENSSTNYVTTQVPQGKSVEAKIPETPLQSNLGTPEHEAKVWSFFEAVLGKEIDPWNFHKHFDFGVLGYQTKNLKFRYSQKRPLTFSLIGEIHRGDGNLPYKRDSIPISLREDIHQGNTDKGAFNLRVVRYPSTGQIELVVKELRLPLTQRGGGVGTLFTERLIQMGRDLGASRILFPNVPQTGWYALLKMGGRLRGKDHWETIQNYFRTYLEEFIEMEELFGFDRSAIRNLRHPRQIANAYFHPKLKKLVLEPFYQTEQDGGETLFSNPHERNLMHVGKRFISDLKIWNWDVAFNLDPQSASMKHFWEYYQHRFDLEPGQRLGEPIDSSPKSPE